MRYPIGNDQRKIKAIRRRYENGEPLKEIAADYGVTHQRIAQIAGKAGRNMKSGGPCSVPDCERDARLKGMCIKHYRHWNEWGDFENHWQARSPGRVFMVRASATRANGKDGPEGIIYAIGLPRDLATSLAGRSYELIEASEERIRFIKVKDGNGSG